MVETVTKEKKEFLESYIKNLKEIDALREELKDWQELSENSPKEAHYVGNISLKKREIEKLENKGLAIKIKILEVTDKIEDKKIRNVLRRRYIHGQSIGEIAKAMYYSKRYIKRLHKKGVDKIDLPRKKATP